MDSPSPSAADHPPQSYSGLLFIGPCEKSRIVAVIEICGIIIIIIIAPLQATLEFCRILDSVMREGVLP